MTTNVGAIVKNKSGAELTIDSLGFTIPDEGTQDLFANDDLVIEVYNEAQIYQALKDGDLVVFFDNTHELSVANGLLLWRNGFTRPKVNLAVNPGVNDDATQGISPGDQVFVTSTGRNWTCATNAVGAATWDEEQVV